MGEIIQFGLLHAEAFCRAQPFDQTADQFYLLHEWLFHQMDRRSWKERKMIYVLRLIDLGGFGQIPGRTLPFLHQEYISQTIKHFPVMQRAYAEAEKLFVLLNVPTPLLLFARFWLRFLSKLVGFDPRQMSKIVILQHDEEQFFVRRFCGAAPMPTVYHGDRGAPLPPGLKTPFPYWSTDEEGIHRCDDKCADASMQRGVTV